MTHPVYRREVHYWTPGLEEPPCGTLDERFEWSDSLDDVTCEACREVLEGEGEPLPDASDGAAADESPLA